MSRSARRAPKRQHAWQEELANSFQNVQQLLDYLELDKPYSSPNRQSTNPFPFKVTRSFAAKIEKRNPDDPLLRQILPETLEAQNPPGFVDNPVGDIEAMVKPGLLHKYHGRVLLITTGACAVNCRYCFRRNYPYSGNQLGSSGRTAALHYIENQPDIKEVILSGGDPLVIGNPGLAELIDSISAVRHVQRLRIHTRIPTVLPARIDAGLIGILESTRLKTIVVTHINHPAEIDDATRNAVAALLNAGVRVLNQAVLLRGVNDDPNSLAELFEIAFDAGIQPYYLHRLDRAAGTAHFEVEEETARSLEKKLRETLPGYLLPRFVREVAGASYKVAV